MKMSDESGERKKIEQAVEDAKEEIEAVDQQIFGRIFRDAPFAPEMVVIKPGSFMMGTDVQTIKALKKQYDDDWFDYEHPQHKVTLSQNFALGRYPVTRGEFSQFISATGYKMPDKSRTYEDDEWIERSGRSWKNTGFRQADNHPVVCVNCDDAQAYIKWLNDKTGQTYRLPTEAEWEYACRAGTTTPFSTGEAIRTDQANYDGNFPYNNGSKGVYRQKTVPVDEFAPNPFGLSQMHGNVSEWCLNKLGEYESGTQTDLQEPALGSYRVSRGGNWFCIARYLRSADRCDSSKYDRRSDQGFRLLRQL
jgi:formylglycine-generating enzyme required for sulfatase activity